MWSYSLSESLKLRSALAPTRQARPDDRRRGATVRLRVEPLEDRCLLSLTPVAAYPVGTSPQAVVTADFNNDGRLDLATADRGGNTVSVLLGNGDGTLQAAHDFVAEWYPIDLAAGDFNGDGNQDIVAAVGSSAGFTGGASVLPGNGDGSFGPPLNFHTALGASSAVAVGDLNADGALDLVLTIEGWPEFVPDPEAPPGGVPTPAQPASVYVARGNGDGTFSGATVAELSGLSPYDVTLGDFNGDAKPDIVALDSFTMSVLLGNGDGTLQPRRDSAVEGWAPRSIAPGDFNRDGKLDLATANFYGGISVLLGDGLGSFGATKQYVAGAGPQSVAVADFNGDGRPDLVTANYYGGDVSVLLGRGDGTFGGPLHSAVGPSPTAVATGDFNGDGRPDVTAANESPSSVSILINDGNWPPPDAPSIAVSDAVVTEGHSGTRTITFTVSLSAAFGQAVTVTFATADGTATVAGGDYRAASGTLTFAAGETSKTITVLVNGDRLGERDETFAVNLGSPTDATIADGQGVATILDDEPRISINDVTRAEGKNRQSTLFTFTVTLSAANDQAVTMSFRTANGSATSGDDYVARTGTLTFAPGETRKTITIAVQGDSKREADEAFYLDLFGSSGDSLLSKYRGVGTILNDD